VSLETDKNDSYRQSQVVFPLRGTDVEFESRREKTITTKHQPAQLGPTGRYLKMANK
jgi:hypothetical protein